MGDGSGSASAGVGEGVAVGDAASGEVALGRGVGNSSGVEVAGGVVGIDGAVTSWGVPHAANSRHKVRKWIAFTVAFLCCYMIIEIVYI